MQHIKCVAQLCVIQICAMKNPFEFGRLKFVQDLTAKVTLSLFFATGLFRLLSTNIPATSGV